MYINIYKKTVIWEPLLSEVVQNTVETDIKQIQHYHWPWKQVNLISNLYKNEKEKG